jgi:hypothetical protein
MLLSIRQPIRKCLTNTNLKEINKSIASKGNGGDGPMACGTKSYGMKNPKAKKATKKTKPKKKK